MLADAQQAALARLHEGAVGGVLRTALVLTVLHELFDDVAREVGADHHEVGLRERADVVENLGIERIGLLT